MFLDGCPHLTLRKVPYSLSLSKGMVESIIVLQSYLMGASLCAKDQLLIGLDVTDNAT